MRHWSRLRVAREQYCIHTASNRKIACARYGEAHAICEPVGPAAPWSREVAAELLDRVLVNATAEQREAIIDRMVRWGEPVWHASARVTGKPCACAACSNPRDPRHPWLISDYTEAA